MFQHTQQHCFSLFYLSIFSLSSLSLSLSLSLHFSLSLSLSFSCYLFHSNVPLLQEAKGLFKSAFSSQRSPEPVWRTHNMAACLPSSVWPRLTSLSPVSALQTGGVQTAGGGGGCCGLLSLKWCEFPYTSPYKVAQNSTRWRDLIIVLIIYWNNIPNFYFRQNAISYHFLDGKADGREGLRKDRILKKRSEGGKKMG